MEPRRQTTEPTHPVLDPAAPHAASARNRFAAYLRAAREARDLSLEEIARTTRIPERSLALLERGDFERLPADVFVRGFLRSYARCVRLDVDETIRRYVECGLPAAPVVSAVVSRRPESAAGVPKVLTAAADEVGAKSAPAAAVEAAASAPAAAVDEVGAASAPAAAVDEVVAASAPAAKEAAAAPRRGGGKKRRRRRRRARAETATVTAAETAAETEAAAETESETAAETAAETESETAAETEAIISTEVGGIEPAVASAAPVVQPPPVLVIDDADPDNAVRTERGKREDVTWRSFLPPVLLDNEEGASRGTLTLAVIILVIVATLTMSYLLRRPTYSGDGITDSRPVASAPTTVA
jgi:hypothetical protein